MILPIRNHKHPEILSLATATATPMKNQTSFSLFVYIVLLFSSCSKQQSAGDNTVFFKDNLVAWCIVPFDSVKRTPVERAAMLKELGIRQFAYDWRAEHLPTFPDEIQALKDHGIALKSVWLWVDTDSGAVIDSLNSRLFDIMRDHHVQTEFWVGFSNRHFDGLTDQQKLDKAVVSVKALHAAAKEIGCTISLYNHGDWFGEPLNQVRIIEKTGLSDIGIVYNFHHAHTQIVEFPQLLEEMLPYLKTVNLNGMKADGPKILPIGQGDAELEMIKTLKSSGYKGAVGILGHVEDADVKQVLRGNLEGLRTLLEKIGDDAAAVTYQ